MDYQKKYSIPRFPSEFLLIGWERGYKNIQVYYKDRLITTISSISKLKNGLKIQDADLNQIELVLSESPIAIDVIFDGIHCGTNVSHPLKEMKKFSPIFWMVAVFALIVSAIEIMNTISVPVLGIITLVVDVLIVSAYIVSAIFIDKSKPWAFWLGFITYCLIIILVLLNGILSLTSVFFLFNLLMRVVFLIFMIRMIKTIISASNHRKYFSGTADQSKILDAI